MILNGYDIKEKIFENQNTIVFRAIQTTTSISVIIKTLKKEFPSKKEIESYEREFEITSKKNISGMLKSYSLEKVNNNYALIFEDIQGISIKKLFEERNIEFIDLIKIFISITKSLESLHQENIIHKDINPGNLLINLNSFDVKIIDFGIAFIDRNHLKAQIKEFNLEGSLAYIAPEQTGRLNIPVDARTDFYSMGITFYELLSKNLPFQTKDAMQMIHSQIALKPDSPLMKSKIFYPGFEKQLTILSKIIMKLIAKNPEERYQSSKGILFDLEKILQNLLSGEIHEVFEIAKEDISEIFSIKSKLFGRDREFNLLLNELKFKKHNHFFIKGDQGCGKSFFINKLHQELIKSDIFFISGTFDELHSNIPYHGIILAGKNFINQLLLENEEVVAAWKHKFQKMIGKNLSLISEIIPEIELITGKLEKAEPLDSTESSNRFQQTIFNFILSMEILEKDIIFFLDNIHLSDPSTISLLEKLFQSRKIEHIIFILSYRTYSFKAEKEPSRKIENLKSFPKDHLLIELKNLDVQTVNLLIAESFLSEQEKLKELSEVIYLKTNGNPFAIIEFIKYAFNEKLIFLNKSISNRNFWDYDLAEIRKLKISENLVDLLISNLRVINPNLLDMLQEASVFGMNFRPEFIAVVMKKSMTELYKDFVFAVQSGILILDNTEFRFIHEKIHSSLYSMISDITKEMIHGKISNYYLENYSESSINENIFQIANHINSGMKYLKPNLKNLIPIQINLDAGRKAKSSAAFEFSLGYLLKGIEQINEPLQIQTSQLMQMKELKINLYIEAADSAFLIKDYDRMNFLFDKIQSQYIDVLVKTRISEVRNKFYIANGEPLKAINESVLLLKDLQVPFPKSPDRLDAIFSILKVALLIRKTDINGLANSKDSEDKNIISAMRLIASIGSAAYISSPDLLPLLILKTVYLSLKHGHTDITPFSYSGYGIILCGILNKFDTGYEFAMISLDLIEKPNGYKMKTKVLHMVNTFIVHWKEHLRLTLPQLQRCYKVGIESGDFEFAFYGSIQYVYHAFFTSSKKLEKLHEEVSEFMEMMSSYQYFNSYVQMNNFLFSLERFFKHSEKLEYNFDSENTIPYKSISIQDSKVWNFYMYFFNLTIQFNYGNYEKARMIGKQAYKLRDTMRSTATLPIFYFYFCLSILKTIESKSYLERKIEMVNVKRLQKQLKLWAKHAPMNQLHRYYLIEAEIHRVENNILKAIEFYDLAIQHSRENEYINDTALANELAGNFFYGTGRKKISEIYLKSSLYFYNLWGAIVKVEQMMKDYPDILGQKDDRSMKALNTFTFHGNNQSFDLSSFLKATETISKEIQFDKLLSSLNQIIIENVGAERGLILLNNNDRLFVECESSITKSETLILKSMPFEGSQLPRSIINYILRSKENVLVNDALTDDRFYRDPYLLENKIKSILCYTILKQDKVFGIFYLENNQSTYAFQSVSEDFLKAISSQAIITIENARLYASLESKVQDRTQELDYSLKQQFILNQDLVKTTNNLNFSLNTLKKDLGLAKKIQESILPKNLESIELLDIATYYAPMEIVGGDFYDIERIGPAKIRIFLADATGHGIQGALVTMAIKSEYENLKTLLSEPHEILEFLNSEFQKKFQSVNVFFTGIVVDIDLSKDKIKYASAGHPAQLIVSESKTEKLTNSGRMIGIKENSGYKQFELDFPKNSKLFIFTDGIYEQINNLRDEFGEDRLFKFLEMNYTLPSHKIIEILINEVDFFMNGSKIEDDITFLAIGNIEADPKIDSESWDSILKSGPFAS